METVRARNKRTADHWTRYAETAEGYRLLGLCRLCATRGATGITSGWTGLAAPCGDCSLIVAGLPIATAHPYWREPWTFPKEEGDE